ncbi:MAG: C40 family peptidase [Muribaculaceae bacterium]|nr:C40 family peptidase [Muribaculaceae bacterium]MDE6753040.1 C40 family peptidase [Muribaculaceae bacterium]
MKRVANHSFIYLILIFFSLGFVSCHSSKKGQKIPSGKKAQVEAVHVGKLNGLQKEIVKEARSWLGTPYCYGASEKGEGTDCSGMVLKVYEKVTGVKLPRNSAKQAEFCKELKGKEVKVGDLAFFATGKDPRKISHVGIMINDTEFIHASTKKGVVVSDITTPYYERTFIMFGRP